LYFALGFQQHCKMQICDWGDLNADIERLVSGVRRGAAVSSVFHLLAVVDDESVHRQAAQIWVREECPAIHDLPALPQRAPSEKLRIGYFSGDLHDHPVAYLAAELFESHDRSRFEISAFSLGPRVQSPIRRRLEKAFDRFVDVSEKPAHEVALLARRHEIDIAVDLGGHTDGARPGILARRAAPIQVAYLGYPGTLGADYIEYLIGDPTVIPPEQQSHYSEKIVYLPHSYLPNDSTRTIDATPTREQEGLPPEGFVFCCFNASFKITPECFVSWMRILARVEGSVLWLSSMTDPAAAGNLQREARRYGVDPRRLIFANRAPLSSQHLARLKLADLVLDTLPYNAHASSVDALWAGVPVLTRIGRAFAGRVAASLLRSIELPELVTTSIQQYESLAIELATNPTRLAQIKQRLAHNRLTTPLFDSRSFVRHLESAYTLMFERYRAGLPPDHMYVAGGKAPAVRTPPEAAPAPPAVRGTSLDQARDLKQRGRLAEALAVCREALAIQPDDTETLLLSAELCVAQGDRDQAVALYAKVIEQRPNQALAYYKRGNLLKDSGQLEASLADYDRAVTLDPNYAYALCNRGFVLSRLGRLDEALASYDRAVAVAPEDALAFFNRAEVLRELKRPQEALASYERAITIRPDYLESHCNRGVLLTQVERYEEAMASFDRALGISDGVADVYLGRGRLLQRTRRLNEAFADFARAANLNPTSAETHYAQGFVALDLERWQDVVASADKAVALKPDYPEAFQIRGNALMNMKRYVEAIRSYEQVLACKPDFQYTRGLLLHVKMLICDWNGLDRDVQSMVAGIRNGRPVALPFPLFPVVEDVSVLHKSAQVWVENAYAAKPELPALIHTNTAAPEKLRVGYFSGDFRDHAVAVLTAELFESHARSRFEITAFSLGRDNRPTPLRQRLEKAFDRFVDVSDKSDVEVARLARSLGIDIAVDLSGHTGGSRMGIFVQRAAPLQVSWLGYPGTVGSDCIDYLIGDPTIIPPEHQAHYSEKIAYLPHCYLPHDSSRAIAEAPTREQVGLPAEGFVFCCFNNSYKITPEVFSSWMRILSRVEHGVLWLSSGDPVTVANLHGEAERRGVDPGRLRFADRVPGMPQHLARLRVPDLFLDTLPYNAHTTAIDALWAGLPVLTRIGQAFAGRVAASLLRAIELPELVTTSVGQYEDLAVELATNPSRLAALKQRLAHARLTAPLFDSRSFVKDLETVYTKIYERYRTGLAPDHINVTATAYP
jgi:predicted O-linked N-acetylglucosamine transferase (SPINDLY family)